MSDDPNSTLPLDGWHRGRGARMVPFAGYAMPIQYEGIIAEHRWTRESAGLFDVSHMGQLHHRRRRRREGARERCSRPISRILKDGAAATIRCCSTTTAGSSTI